MVALVGPIMGLSCASLSIIASSCLLYWLCTVQQAHRQKLMCRQLWHLTIADLVFCVFSACYFVFWLVAQQRDDLASSHSTKMDNACLFMTFAYNIGFDTSVIMEAHLALSFTAAIYRWPLVLQGLSWLLWLAWPLGIMVAVTETWVVGVYWDGDSGCSPHHEDIYLIGLQMVCVGIAVTCYFLSFAKTCSARHTSPNAVQVRVWRRVHTYLLAWLFCDLPEFTTLFSSDLTKESSAVYPLIALSLFNLNPLANVLVYAYQSKYVHRIEANRSRRVVGGSRAAPFRAAASYPIAFGADSVVEFSPTTSSPTESERHSADSALDIEDLMFSCLEITPSCVISGDSGSAEGPVIPSTHQA